jgi:hypothetical protein
LEGGARVYDCGNTICVEDKERLLRFICTSGCCHVVTIGVSLAASKRLPFAHGIHEQRSLNCAHESHRELPMGVEMHAPISTFCCLFFPGLTLAEIVFQFEIVFQLFA